MGFLGLRVISKSHQGYLVGHRAFRKSGNERRNGIKFEVANQDWLEGGMGHKNQEAPTKSYIFQIQVKNMRKLNTKICFAFPFYNQETNFPFSEIQRIFNCSYCKNCHHKFILLK